MSNIKRESKKLLIVVVILLPFVLIPSVLFGGEDEKKVEGKSESKASIVLTIKDEIVSLKAKDASLKEIIEEIGRKMKIEVIANITEEEKVTLKFDRLSIADALEKLTTNYGYVMDSEKKEKKITKIIVLPKGQKTASSRTTTKQTRIQEEEKKEVKRPEPFKFEFDPSEFMEEDK